jgi:hypothetical protein
MDFLFGNFGLARQERRQKLDRHGQHKPDVV